MTETEAALLRHQMMYEHYNSLDRSIPEDRIAYSFVKYRFKDDDGSDTVSLLPPPDDRPYEYIILDQKEFLAAQQDGRLYDTRHTGRVRDQLIDERKAPGS
jgi:hypothetical protein